MADFNELQTLWQSQKTAPGPPVEDLIRALRGHSRKHMRIYVGKGALVLAMTAMMLAALRESPLALAGALLVVGGAMAMLALESMAHLALARLEFTRSASGFARAAIGKLRRLEKPQAAQYGALLLGPVAGLNLVELHFLRGLAWELRIAMHLGLSLFAVAAAWGGFRVRARRFERETRPLLARLEAFVGPDASETSDTE